MLNNFKIVALTHKKVQLNQLGDLIIPADELKQTLLAAGEQLELRELLYLGTCNRVEFAFVSDRSFDHPSRIGELLKSFYHKWDDNKISSIIEQSEVYQGIDAVEHLFRVSSSLDSLIVGEKEIFPQYRAAYQTCNKLGLTGDFLKILDQCAVKNAKQIYSQTKISENPVSVASLACRKVRQITDREDPKFILIGAGQTMKLISKYLAKHGFSSIAVFNRSVKNAEILAKELNGTAYPLDMLAGHPEPFDVIITCTASAKPIITPQIYSSLVKGDSSQKIILDLAVPNDTHPEVLQNNNIKFISIDQLHAIASENLLKRQEEIAAAEVIIKKNIIEYQQVRKEREVEAAMRSLPQKIKEIHATTVNEVFANRIGRLDNNAKELLTDVVNYLEKKYISVPMRMAKDILTNY